jgi:hypothetical protein
MFTAHLDFGSEMFDGTTYWLEVGVRPAIDDPPAFTILAPRQPITAAPYATYAYNAPFATNGNDVYYEDGRLGIGTSTPSGALEVSGPATNESVVLPGNAISSVESLDEPGLAHTFVNGPIPGFYSNTVFATSQITCPTAGFVLAIATVGVTVDESQFSRLAIVESTHGPTAPSDAYPVWPNGVSAEIRDVITLQRVFPIGAGGGALSVQLRGWGSSDDGIHMPNAEDPKLTLLFVPTAYGNVNFP